MKKQAATGMHYKKDISENFARFTIKYLYWRLCFDKRAAILLETLTQVFSVNFVEFFKSTSYKRTPVVAASVRRSVQDIISIIISS